MDARSGGDYRTYFLSCDGHWTKKGSAMAAQILEPWLAQLSAATKKDQSY
jgi:hypothetical protein